MTFEGKKTAILLAEGFDANQYLSLHNQLMNAGILVSVVGENEDEELKDAENDTEVSTEVSFNEARSYNFNGAIISGKLSPDIIRSNSDAISFVKDIYEKGGLVGSIDHGAQVLITAALLEGKNATGPNSIKKDIENAKARYLDEPVVIDGNLITARGSDDINEFCRAIISKMQGFERDIA